METIIGTAERKKWISSKDEEAMRMCYEDYCDESTNKLEEEVMNFEDFRDILLLGNWDNEIFLLERD